MNWLFLSLLTALLWGVSAVASKKGFENISPLWNNILANLATIFIWIPFSLVLGEITIKNVGVNVWLMIFVIALTYQFYFYAISKGEISLTGTVVAGYPISTVVLSYLFLGERLSAMQIIALVIAMISVILIFLPERVTDKIIKSRDWVWWGVISAILIGLGDFLSKISINNIGTSNHLVILSILSNLTSVILYLIDRRGRSLPRFSYGKFLPTFIGVTLLPLGTAFFFTSLGRGLASLVVPISSIYPAITVVLAGIFLKERVSLRQGIGIFGVILGVILLSINTY